jgi:hypothetical protein
MLSPSVLIPKPPNMRRGVQGPTLASNSQQ